jgi:hypothetical protein
MVVAETVKLELQELQDGLAVAPLPLGLLGVRQRM